MSIIHELRYVIGLLSKKSVEKYLEEAFGSVPKTTYDDGDMERIQALYHSKMKASNEFIVDDITWNDLSMDSVYRRVNNTLSTPGEQYLYHMLRCPAMDGEEFAARRDAVRLFEEDTRIRKSVQRKLLALGKNRNLKNADIFSPPKISSKWPWITVFLIAFLILSIGMVIYNPTLWFPLLISMILGPIYQTYMMGRIDLSPVNYSVAMIKTAKGLRKQEGGILKDIAAPMFDSLAKVGHIARLGGVSFAANADFVTFINVYLHLDLLMYVRLRHQLHRHQTDIAILHEYLGRIDAAIAIASYRKSVEHHTIPDIDFSNSAPPSLSIQGMIHPLILKAVPNDLDMHGAILLTGSNASGKSTYLKAVAINAILSQGIATALCSEYKGTCFNIYTSMAISDDVLSGASYFIAEIKSLKRILDAVQKGEKILCAIDEVLRGTNTTERVAASSELLRALDRENCLAIAATHDQELCSMLSPEYALFHFEEKIENNEISFDYRLKSGPATTKNAVALLEIMGFHDEIIKKAREKIAGYEKSGNWGK